MSVVKSSLLDMRRRLVERRRLRGDAWSGKGELVRLSSIEEREEAKRGREWSVRIRAQVAEIADGILELQGMLQILRDRERTPSRIKRVEKALARMPAFARSRMPAA